MKIILNTERSSLEFSPVTSQDEMLLVAIAAVFANGGEILARPAKGNRRVLYEAGKPRKKLPDELRDFADCMDDPS